MATGTVKWFNAQKGYGFIQPDDGSKDVFVHISAVERSGIGNLHEGQKLSFDLERGQQGKTSAVALKAEEQRTRVTPPCTGGVTVSGTEDGEAQIRSRPERAVLAAPLRGQLRARTLHDRAAAPPGGQHPAISHQGKGRWPRTSRPRGSAHPVVRPPLKPFTRRALGLDALLGAHDPGFRRGFAIEAADRGRGGIRDLDLDTESAAGERHDPIGRLGMGMRSHRAYMVSAGRN